jgi:ribosomal protein L29
MNKEKVELKSMNADQLREKVELLRQELLGLRLSASTTHVKNYAQFNEIKKNIARALTYLNQKNEGSLKKR